MAVVNAIGNTLQSPFTVESTSVTSTGTQLNLLNACTATNGGVVYSGSSVFGITAAGTSGQVLQSAGAAAPVWATMNGKLLAVQVITSSGTVTANANATKWLFYLKGGGGAGQSGLTAGTLPGQGGSEGGLCIGYVTVTGSTGYTYTQGAGGSAAAAGGQAAGGNGNNSTLVIGATTYQGNGGEGGGIVGAGYGSKGGTTTNATIGINGQSAATVTSAATSASGAGAGSGGGQGTVGIGVAGVANTGGGGSGGYGNNAGGAGGSGYLVVYEYS